jgi:predicted glycosyl hydrolase (DUF1957 family)
MTQDEIIDLAYKAGLEVHKWKKTKEYQIRCWYEEFYDFAQLVAQQEREACAKEAEKTFYSVQAAENIRARGK